MEGETDYFIQQAVDAADVDSGESTQVFCDGEPAIPFPRYAIRRDLISRDAVRSCGVRVVVVSSVLLSFPVVPIYDFTPWGCVSAHCVISTHRM